MPKPSLLKEKENINKLFEELKTISNYVFNNNKKFDNSSINIKINKLNKKILTKINNIQKLIKNLDGSIFPLAKRKPLKWSHYELDSSVFNKKIQGDLWTIMKIKNGELGGILSFNSIFSLLDSLHDLGILKLIDDY